MTGPERAADADRERAVAALREHAVAGRLTLGELADRVGNALTANTQADLEVVLGDLPAAVEAPGDEEPSRVLALFGDVDVVVPHGVALDMSGYAIFGSQRPDTGDERPPPGAPTVHLRAQTAFGSLTMRRV